MKSLGKFSHKRDGYCYHKNTACHFLTWVTDGPIFIHDYCKLFQCRINRNVTDHCRETLEADSNDNSSHGR
jgi:hypothetical protein